MSLDLAQILGRARVFLMICGLAFLFGLQVPAWARVLIVAMTAAALTFDSWADRLPPWAQKKTPNPHYGTAA